MYYGIICKIDEKLAAAYSLYPSVKDENMNGLYNKYNISKTDGTPTDPSAEYLVLRLDTDKHARKSAKIYAKIVAEERNLKPLNKFEK